MKKSEKGRNKSMSLPIVLHYNQKIANYSKQKQYQLACQSFELMIQNHVNPDVVTYNTMINVYVKSQRLTEAFALFEQMKKSNINPTIVTYTSLIDGCGKCNNLERAMQVYNHVKSIGLSLNMHFFNAILNATLLQGNLKSVEIILNDIKQSGLQPNTVTYNTMLTGYIRLNLLSKMQQAIEEMILFKIEFSGVTQATILQAIQLVRDYDSLSQFINLLTTSKITPSPSQSTQLILELVSNQYLLLAQNLCDHLIKIGCQISIEAFSSMIELAGFFSNIEIIQWCSEKASKFNINLSFQTFLAHLCLFARFKNYEKAVQTYDQITFNHELIPTHIKLSLIDCFLSHDDIERSLKATQRWISENNEPDKNSPSNSPFSSDDVDNILSLYFERSLYNEVMTISSKVRELKNIALGMKGSNFTLIASIKIGQFSTLIPSISEFSPSCDVLAEIVSSISPNDLTLIPWNSLIENCCSAYKKSMQNAIPLTTSQNNVISPPILKTSSSIQLGNTLLSTCKKNSSLFKSSLPSPPILCNLMKSFCKHKLDSYAWETFKHFTSIGIEMNSELITLAAQCVMDVQPADENDIMYIFEKAREGGVELTSELYSLGVDAAIKNGDFTTAVSMKFEMDAAGHTLKEPTNSLFQQNYEYIKQALPQTPPPVVRKARRRSRTMPTPNVSANSHLTILRKNKGSKKNI